MTRMLTDIPQTNDTKTTARLDAETHLAPIEDIVADIAAGDTSGAVDAYEHALHNIDADDPRGVARKEKISGAVAQLTGAAHGRP